MIVKTWQVTVVMSCIEEDKENNTSREVEHGAKVVYQFEDNDAVTPPSHMVGVWDELGDDIND